MPPPTARSGDGHAGGEVLEADDDRERGEPDDERRHRRLRQMPDQRPTSRIHPALS